MPVAPLVVEVPDARRGERRRAGSARRRGWRGGWLLALVGLTTGLLDVAINAEAARLEAAFRIRLMDGLHAAFSVGVLVGGVGAGLLRNAGAHPSWILAGVGVLIALSATGNRGGERARAPGQRRARPGKALLVIGEDQFSCEWRNRKVAVNYKAGGAGDGDLVSLEVQ